MELKYFSRQLYLGCLCLPTGGTDLLETALALYHCFCPGGCFLCHHVNHQKKLPETGLRLCSWAASPFPPSQTPTYGLRFEWGPTGAGSGPSGKVPDKESKREWNEDVARRHQASI